ncbi:MAG: 5-oxoprolinase subunit PxpA [Pseudomonadota bacterium]
MTGALRMDLNADLGELPDPEGRASDAAILASVTSCAIACGGHAGSPAVMSETLKLADRLGVICGAHPSYPDRENFGRKSLAISSSELVRSLMEQLERLIIVARDEGIPLHHVKPHGALYNDAARSSEIANAVIEAVRGSFSDEQPAIICQPGFSLADAASAAGLDVLGEGFIDRAYRDDGTLQPRTRPGAVIASTEERVRQARQITLHRDVTTDSGVRPLKVQTLCIHGDSPGAPETARAVKAALQSDGVRVAPYTE